MKCKRNGCMQVDSCAHICNYEGAHGGFCMLEQPHGNVHFDGVGYFEDAKPYSSSHYVSKREGLEAIDVIEAFDLNRNLANVCKYILRCNHKGQRDSDLEKAINYLWRERYGTWLPTWISDAAKKKSSMGK